MITIKIENNSEQASALISYLETLPFVTIVNDCSQEAEIEEIIKEEVIIKESEPVKEIIIKEEKVAVEEIVVLPVVKEEKAPEKPHIATGGSTFSESFEKLLLVDLKKSLNLNDKFRFQRDLFHGSGDEMNLTLEYLNKCNSYSEAINYIETKYKWDSENESFVAFRTLLEKRYS